MAATRKLQGEIDKCLKKVAEGVETFEDIWQKVHNATNSNQKEKYEGDLKKEIKKLQRLREQIKSWIASAEIKDKSALLENRRLIETQMERFKVVERATKTKAYSKEGLGAAQKLDPAQREKEDLCCWLTSSITSLQLQQDQYESEVESIMAAKKKRLDKDKQDKVDDLKSKLERHKFHITKLETLLRLVDNDQVDLDQVKKIKDDVEYYIESSQEPDFEENEYLYDDIIGLDEIELSGTEHRSAGTTDSNNSNDTAGGSPSSLISNSSPVTSPTLNCSTITAALNHSGADSTTSTNTDAETQKRNAKNNDSNSTKVTPVKPTPMRAGNKFSDAVSPATSSSNSSSQQKSGGNNTITNKIIGGNATTLASLSAAAAGITSPSTIPSTAPIAFAAVAKQTLENGPITLQSTQQSISSVVSSSANSTSQNNSVIMHNNSNADSNHHGNSAMNNCVSPSNSGVSSRTSPSLTSPLTATHLVNGPTSNLVNNKSNNIPLQHQQQQQSVTQSGEKMSTLKTIAQEAVNALDSNATNDMNAQQPSSGTAQTPVNTPSHLQQSTPQPADTRQGASAASIVGGSGVQGGYAIDSTATNGPNSVVGGTSSGRESAKQLHQSSSATSNQNQAATNEAHIPPLLGVAPLGQLTLQKEHQIQFQLMEASFYHLPQPCDSERLRNYLQRQPVQTPPHYPQQQLPHSDTFEFFQRLSTETLFFIFYYMEGTKAQYLAAKALKKQSWRFHTKYMMWFQRHEEPKVINEEYEQGTYIYFDYEKWGQRKKEGFTFEYKYLEDRDLN
ncbi:CCR4-NOT transcription complex subunit 3 [Culicoides brevitarsis]|uniref:CCR4-NOT transcription complex subunit 3 n=1 Tax=Culicoides brevitarsis TaxID=469753 RepID=UPI00307C94A6